MKAKVRQLRSELKNTKKGTHTINEFVLHIKAICDSLVAIGDSISEKDQIDAILEGLPEEYGPFVMMIYGRSDSPSVSDIESLLLLQEAQLDKFKTELLLLRFLLMWHKLQVVLTHLKIVSMVKLELILKIKEVVVGVVVEVETVIIEVEEGMEMDLGLLFNCVSSMVMMLLTAKTGLMKILCNLPLLHQVLINRHILISKYLKLSRCIAGSPQLTGTKTCYRSRTSTPSLSSPYQY